MKTKHTRTPWNAGKPLTYLDKFIPLIAENEGCPDAVLAVVGYDASTARIKANAEFIVTACNHHEKMLRELHSAIARCREGLRNCEDGDLLGVRLNLTAIADESAAVIQKIEGE
jgi:hypothetical protein